MSDKESARRRTRGADFVAREIKQKGRIPSVEEVCKNCSISKQDARLAIVEGSK